MASHPYLVPDEFLRAPPRDHLQTAMYIKHVELRDKLVDKFDYAKLNNNLLTEYLMSTDPNGPQVIDRLMIMSFKTRSRNSEPSRYPMEILQRGVQLSGVLFRYLGHSNSQLKEKTCFLMAATDKEIHDLLANFADFSKIPSIAKRAKRVALLFSAFNNSIRLHENEYDVIDDVHNNIYNFTDGCGFMSDDLAREIKRTHRLNHTPSVVQIRYQGFKGVLLHLPQLQGLKVQFRKSMKKFMIPDEHVRHDCSTLGVVEYSKPYSSAYLNTQLTMLLADNGEPGYYGHGYLLQLQREFHDMLRKLCTDEEAALHYLTVTGKENPLKRLRKLGLFDRRVQQELGRMRNGEIRKMQKDEENNYAQEQSLDERRSLYKLRVLIPKARIVFGVCDPYGELECGEVYFRPSLPDGELAEFDNAKYVVVGRNPCYYPGDLRVLKLANIQDKMCYIHLFDCIVFPTKGDRPHPDECSGGDLDGDKFFVSWDQRLVPQWTTQPFTYAEVSQMLSWGNLLKSICSPLSNRLMSFGRAYLPRIFGTEEQALYRAKFESRAELMNYFATYNNDLVCRVNGIFMRFAARYGPSCEACVYLNKYFSDAVDMVANQATVQKDLEELEKRYRQAESMHGRGRRPYQMSTSHTQELHRLTGPSQQIRKRRLHQTRASESNSLLGSVMAYVNRPTKSPFREGDDVWTEMERLSGEFVQEMHILSNRPY